MKQKRMGRAIWMAFLLAALLTLTAMAGDVQATVPQLETPALGQWSNAAIGWTAVDEAQYYNVVLYHAETMGGTLTRVEGITKTKNEYTVPRTAYETYQTGCFYVKVQARTPDSTLYTSSDWVTSAPLAADSLRALETPGNVRWLQEAADFDAEGVNGGETVSLKPGTLVWDAVEGAGEYLVSLYRGQTPVAQAELLGDGYPGYTNPRMNYCDFYLDYLEPGNQYYFSVRAYPPRDPYDGYPYYSEFAYSATLDYQPGAQLDAPTNFRWEGKTLFWDAPAGDLDGYWVTWYHADTLDGEKTELRTERVFSDSSATVYSQETSGYLFAKVRARSADVLDVAYSDWSDFSPAYSIGDLPQLETPANVQWVTASHSFEAVDSDSTETVMVYPGFVTWAPVSSAYSYQVTLSCGGEAVLDTTAYSNYYDFTKAICANGSGVYTVTVTAKSLGSDYQPSDPSQPVAWQYEEPTEALTAPTDLRFIQFEGGWQGSADARGYEVDWRFGATAEAIPQSISAVADRTDATAVIMPSHYLTWRGNGWYSYRVRAIPADISRYCYSDWVESPAGYREEADKLTTPANFAWNGRFCNWSVPTNGTVDHYELQLYYSAASDDDLRQVDSFMSIEPQMELSRYLLEEHGEGYYAIKVKAFSADILTARDSDWSELSPVYNTAAAARLDAPTELNWVQECREYTLEQADGTLAVVELSFGDIYWKPAANANLYCVELYQADGTKVSEVRTTDTWYSLHQHVTESGTYYAMIQSERMDGAVLPSEAAKSSQWIYDAPAAKLGTPSQLNLAGGVASWEAPAGEVECYEIEWYRAPNATGPAGSIGTETTSGTKTAMPNWYISTYGAGYYALRVRAISADISLQQHSDWTAISDLAYVDAVPKLDIPTNLRWITEADEYTVTDLNGVSTRWLLPGTLLWEGDRNADYYDVMVYRDGTMIYNTICFETCLEVIDLVTEYGSGAYSAQISAASWSGVYDNSAYAEAPQWQLSLPDTALAAPSDLLLQGVTAQWSATSQAGRFELNWYFRATQEQEKKDTGRGSSPEAGASAAALPRSVLERYGAGYYSFGIQAVTGDIAAVRSSDWVYSKEVYLDPAGSSYADAVKASLTLVAQAVSAQEAQSMAQEQIGTDNLLAAMEADPSVAQKIQQLEQKLQLTTEVNSTVAALPESMVEVTGAALNVQAGATNTTLNIRAAQATALPAEYAGMEATLFSMSLTHVDESADGHQYLSIPVQITLPIPAYYAPGQVKLLHRLTDTNWTVLTPEVTEQDGRWYASVVVTQLSDFAIVADRSASSVVMTVAGEIQVAAGDMPEQTAFICVAVYDCQGRMVAVARTAVKPGQNVYALNAGLDAPPQDGEVRAFFLDAQNAPMAPCCKYLL